MKVLVVGSTGAIGDRIVEILVAGRHEVLCGSRDWERARSEARRRGAAGGIAFRRSGDVASVAAYLRHLRVDVVVDASGPFRDYEPEARYALAEAACDAGCCYLDVADDPDFVAGIASLDGRARARGVYALSGAATFPVLVEAAVRHVAPSFFEVRSVTAGVAPSSRTKVGRNSLRSILGYVGKATRVPSDDGSATLPAMVSTRRRAVDAPKGVMSRKTFGLCPVPEMESLKATGLVSGTVWAGVAPPSLPLRALLGILGRGRSYGVLPDLAFLAPAAGAVVSVASRFGEDVGGLFVDVFGTDDDALPRHRSLDIVAWGPDGASIPAMTVAGILARHADGRPPAPGARPAGGSLDMADYDRQFAGRDVTYGFSYPAWAMRPAVTFA